MHNIKGEFSKLAVATRIHLIMIFRDVVQSSFFML